MKKLILFIVLILGFINENKAQFAASSEIYHYVDIDANERYASWMDGGLQVYSLKFYTDKMTRAFEIGNTLDELRLNNPDFDDVYHYNEKHSNHKYFVYSRVRRQDWTLTTIDYCAISKDREEFIIWTTFNGKASERHYYKRVTINEIKTLLKPQFDFLE